MKQENRVYLWDNLKFILILLVVIGHFLERNLESSIFKSIFIFIYAFHMPFFIFLSGLFHKNERIAQKVISYIILGYSYKIFIFITRSILGENPSFSLFKEDGIPWYMFALAAFILISYLVRDINPKFIFLLSVILACFTGYDKSIGDTLVLCRIIVFYPYYYLGTLLDKEKLVSVTKRPIFKLTSIITIALWGTFCLFMLRYAYAFRPLFTGRNPFNETFYFGGCFFRLACYFLAISLGFSLMCLVPSMKFVGITTFGSRTLQVYFWHRPILYFISHLNIINILCESNTGKIFYLLCSIPFTLLLSTKLFSFPTTQILQAVKNNIKKDCE